MGVIAVDTDQVRAIAQFCVEDAASLREVRGAVDRAWGVGGLPPTVLRLRGECDIPLATVSRIAHELESEADKLRNYADRIDGIEQAPWTPPHIVPVRPFDWSKASIRQPEDDKHPDPLWSWITGVAAGAWGAIQGALKKVADLAKRAEEILAHLIASLTKLATGFVRTADTMQRAVTRWVGGNVVDPILHFPQDWDAWMRHDEHRGIMGPLGTAIDWIGSREHDIEVGLGKLLLLDGKQNSFQDILLNAIPIFGEARGAYRLGMAYKGGDFNSMAWEAAGLALPFFGGAALRSFGAGAGAVEKGVMTAAGKAAKAVPFFQDLWSHRGDILHDIAKGAGGLYEGAKNWAADRWGDITRAWRKGQDIIERGWENFLRDVEKLGKNFVSAAEGVGTHPVYKIGRDSLIEWHKGSSGDVSLWRREGRIGNEALNGRASIDFLRAWGTADANAALGKDGLTLSAALGGGVDLLRVKAGANAQQHLGQLASYQHAEVDAMVGAEAQLSGKLHLSGQGLAAEGMIGGFAGARATGQLDTGATFAGNDVRVGAEASVEYGLDAHAKGKVSFTGHKLKLSGDVGLALGPGLRVAPTWEIDYSGAANAAQALIRNPSGTVDGVSKFLHLR